MSDIDEEIIQKFAAEQGLDPEKVKERWNNDPVQIAEDIFRVEDQDTGQYRDLELFEVQKKVVEAYFYGDNGTINLYKGRRIGYSFIVCVIFLIEAMMIPNSVYPVVSTKQGQANNRISDIEDLVKHAKIDIPTEKENNDELVLWNGSSFKAYSGSPDSSRGDDSARGVLLDEMAFLEDQKEVSRAFGAFLALGEEGSRKMFEVSTPKVSSDLFMTNHKEGSKTGYVKKEYDEEKQEYITEDVPPTHPEAEPAGTLSIRQPSFYNADEIDIHTPLQEQEVRPVRPDMNLNKIEDERAKDPKGFGQEYLCRPVDDTYAFFDEESIERAMERDLPSRKPQNMVVMGVDIGISHDDTVASVVEHRNDGKAMRRLEVLNDENLRKKAELHRESENLGPRHIAHQIAKSPDRSNPRHIAYRISRIASEYNVDYIVMDRTGPGEGFRSVIEDEFGRGLIGFNFSDKDEVESMMGDMNMALRNDNVVLPDHSRLLDELSSIQKIQDEDFIKPKFTGKDFSETGKDDTAMAAVLACFPPNLRKEPSTQISSTERKTKDETRVSPTSKKDVTDEFADRPESAISVNFGSTSSSGRSSGRKQYNARHRR